MGRSHTEGSPLRCTLAEFPLAPPFSPRTSVGDSQGPPGPTGQPQSLGDLPVNPRAPCRGGALGIPGVLGILGFGGESWRRPAASSVRGACGGGRLVHPWASRGVVAKAGGILGSWGMWWRTAGASLGFAGSRGEGRRHPWFVGHVVEDGWCIPGFLRGAARRRPADGRAGQWALCGGQLLQESTIPSTCLFRDSRAALAQNPCPPTSTLGDGGSRL
jgi:hypothetical protein